MNSIQEQQLLRYLGGIGFSAPEFSATLSEKIALNRPSFTVEHTIPFGKEKMLFNLRFQKDLQFDAYRLDSYRAALRKDPTIEHTVIDGMDTAILEQGFKEINWDQYFEDPKNLTRDQEQKIKVVLNDLWQLTAQSSEQAKEIQDLLQYKYWREHAQMPSAKFLKQTYEVERKFDTSEFGICNVNLAYHILNGQLDKLYERIADANLHELPGSDFHADLDKILSTNPDRFELIYKRNEPTGYTEIIIPVERINGEYSLDGYSVTLTPYPQIEHGVYNGIDSEKLEQQMCEIDWHKDNQLFIFHEQAEPKFLVNVADVQKQMYSLSQDVIGTHIADQLQLKYWSDATFFEDNIEQPAWDYLQSLPKRTQKFSTEMDATSAINLLYGRAVINYAPNLTPQQEAESWIRFNLNEKDAQGNFPIIKMDGFSKGDVENLLEIIPINTSDFYPVRNSLLRGDLTAATLKTNNNIVYLQANPEQKTLDIFTPDHRSIPFNFNLDPNWKPEKSTTEQLKKELAPRQENSTRSHRRNNIKKHKGRGL